MILILCYALINPFCIASAQVIKVSLCLECEILTWETFLNVMKVAWKHLL
jgi:hypothetical protein